MDIDEGEGFSFSQSSDLIERYKETIKEVEEVNEALRYIPTAWPTVPDTITSDFGVRSDPFHLNDAIHSGIDVRGSIGTPVYAAADGTVTKAEYYGGYGNTIMIRHSDTYQTIYAHLSEINVDQGETVKKGETIGSIGSTGRSTGPHLHYEIIKDNEPVDPKTYINIYE
nr:M23 family metallopeptidase [Ornithinibacillus caprae]